MKPKNGVEVTIAVPITLFVTREVVGSFLGPIELWRARFSGTFDIQDQTGDSAEQATWKMAERLERSIQLSDTAERARVRRAEA